MLIPEGVISKYPKSGYTYGTCPGCKEWEAPATAEEITNMKEPYAHHGSTERKVDDRARYYREVWRECYQCPKCKTRFSVEMSNT